MADNPQDDKLTEFQLALITRRDQILLLDKISALEAKYKQLEYLLKHHDHLPTKPAKKGRTHGRH